jgi:hypothetical protein
MYKGYMDKMKAENQEIDNDKAGGQAAAPVPLGMPAPGAMPGPGAMPAIGGAPMAPPTGAPAATI